jgi:hypothetical protein
MKRAPRVYFWVENLYYMFMVVFIKKISLFLLTPVASKICINIQLVNRLQVPAKNIHNTHVEGENVQIFKYLKITMEKYVLHSDFHAIDMVDEDIVLGYPWMESVGTVNINMKKKFLKLWYKKKKITL